MILGFGTQAHDQGMRPFSREVDAAGFTGFSDERTFDSDQFGGG